MKSNSLKKKIEILEFLFELGATEAHESEPINRLRLFEEEKILNKAGDLEQDSKRLLNSTYINLQKSPFAELIEKATTVNELQTICANYGEFSSSKLSNKMNFSFGNFLANVMIICEPPGRMEIKDNVIYSGDRGLIFQKMYEAIGLSVEAKNLYVVPIFPWRLSPNPNNAEKDMKLFFYCVKKHISIVKPKVLVFMDKGFAASENQSINFKEDNEEYGCQDDPITFSIETPARLLDNSYEKRAAWKTLKYIRDILKKNNE